MSEMYVTYLVWDGCRAPGNLEYNGRLCGQRVRAVPFDRDALLALADELEQETGSVCGVCMGKTARRIRKAIGVDDAEA